MTTMTAGTAALIEMLADDADRPTPVPLRVVAWAAAECRRQQSGELSVQWMVQGWLYARTQRTKPLTLDRLLTLGRIVEPRHNAAGLRTVGVRVGADVKMPPGQVPAAIEGHVAAWGDAQAAEAWDEWYRVYEEIHPFRDGNGRTGNILHNWMRGTLLAPTVPPDFWEADWDEDTEIRLALSAQRALHREEG